MLISQNLWYITSGILRGLSPRIPGSPKLCKCCFCRISSSFRVDFVGFPSILVVFLGVSLPFHFYRYFSKYVVLLIHSLQELLFPVCSWECSWFLYTLRVGSFTWKTAVAMLISINLKPQKTATFVTSKNGTLLCFPDTFLCWCYLFCDSDSR